MAEIDDKEDLTDRQRGRDFVSFSRAREDVCGCFENDRNRFDEMLGKDAVGNGNLGEIATHGVAPRLERDRRTHEAEQLTRRRGGFGLR